MKALQSSLTTTIVSILASHSHATQLLTADGVAILDDLFESIVKMRSRRWDGVELVSAPDFGEVVRVEDQGILLIAPTRTHVHVAEAPSESKLCVLNHLLETLQFVHTAEFSADRSHLVLLNPTNGEALDLRQPHLVPTPLFLRSERAERGIAPALPGEIIVKRPSDVSASESTTQPENGAAPAVAPTDGKDLLPKRSASAKKRDLSRVQWRLSRNISVEFVKSLDEHVTETEQHRK